MEAASARPNTPTSPLNAASYLGVGSYAILGPTTATLAITRLSVYNTVLNSNHANTTFAVYLSKRAWDSTNGCPSAGQQVNRLRSPIGSTMMDSWPTPLVFQPTGTTPYCVMATINGENTDPGTYYLPFVSLTGYVAKGTYTGNGVPTKPEAGLVPGSDRPPLATPSNRTQAGADAPAVMVGDGS